MPEWLLNPGLYLLGVAVIPAVALVLVCWGLLGRRAPGRPSCPKCGHGMSATLPAVVCPKCGHDAGDADRLHRSRRRAWPIALGVVLVLLFSYPLATIGGYHREQAIISASGISLPAGMQGHLGPQRVVSQLPDRIARFFERVNTVNVHDDSQLAACARLGHLSEVIIAPGPGVTDMGLAQLRGISQLRELQIPGRPLTAGTLQQLHALPNLETLMLSGTEVTDVAVAQIEGLPGLKVLYLKSTAVTKAGVKKLKQALPKLEVTRWQVGGK